MKLYVLNGANLNLLGLRQPELYGKGSYDDLLALLKKTENELGVELVVMQSNHEGDLVDRIQAAYGSADGIVINPGAYTHTSVALLDALKAVNLPTVEVHLTDVDNREDYRKISYVSEYAFLRVTGKGFQGYLEALDALKARVQ